MAKKQDIVKEQRKEDVTAERGGTGRQSRYHLHSSYGCNGSPIPCHSSKRPPP